MNVFRTSDRIIYDSRCGMSDVAFCSAPPIGGPSCFNFDKCRPEAAGNVISGIALDYVSIDVPANFGNYRLNSSQIKLFDVCPAIPVLCTFVQYLITFLQPTGSS